MCEDARLNLVYREIKELTAFEDNSVFAELREWTTISGRSDYVLETEVYVDGEEIHGYKVLQTFSRSMAVREAIEIFDDLVKNHPHSYLVENA